MATYWKFFSKEENLLTWVQTGGAADSHVWLHEVYSLQFKENSLCSFAFWNLNVWPTICSHSVLIQFNCVSLPNSPTNQKHRHQSPSKWAHHLNHLNQPPSITYLRRWSASYSNIWTWRIWSSALRSTNAGIRSMPISDCTDWSQSMILLNLNSINGAIIQTEEFNRKSCALWRCSVV